MSRQEYDHEANRELLAFRYVAGELDGEETAAFEAELETSQPTREAVARAIELSQAVALAESQQVVPLEVGARGSQLRRSWLYGFGLVGAGAVAASVAGVVWWNTKAARPETPSIAEAWVASPKVSRVEILPDEPMAEPATRFEATIAPSWMTAGVISLSGGKIDDDTDGDGKPDESWDDEVWEN